MDLSRRLSSPWSMDDIGGRGSGSTVYPSPVPGDGSSFNTNNLLTQGRFSMHTRNVMMWCVVFSVMLLLAGCGGNGGGPTAMEPMEPMEPTTPTPPTCMADPDDPDCTGPRPMEGPTAMVMGLTAAIADPDGDGEFPEDGELNSNSRPSADISAGPGGELTVDGDELGKNDPSLLNTLEFQPLTGASRASLRDFDVSVYQRTKNKKTDTLTVYMNVDDAGSQEFDAYYTATDATARLEADGADGATFVAVDDAEGAAKTMYGTLTFADSGATEGNGYKYMKGGQDPDWYGAKSCNGPGRGFYGDIP